MKWTNKGHEFDEIGAVFQKNDTLVLVGKQSDNDVLKKKLDFLDVTIENIDTDFDFNIEFHSSKNPFKDFVHKVFNKIKRSKKQMEFNKIYSEKSLYEQTGKTMVLSGDWGGGGGAEYFEHTGKYHKNVNIFDKREFMEKYLSIFAVYVCNKVYLWNIGIIVTTICNLNCKYCLNFTPYNKNMKHRPLEELKKEVDVLFACVDILANFSVSGGEPMLYPYLGELLQYIADKYRDKIWILGIGTNGTIMPSDELCKIFKENRISVYADDYSKTIPNIKFHYNQFIKKMMAYNTDIHQIYIESFYNVFPPLEIYSRYNEQSLSDKFDKCIHVHYQDQKNGRIAACCYGAYALEAELINESKDDYFDINNFDNSMPSKKEFVEFRLGYSNKGYVEFCKYCNGFPAINSHIEANGAEQAKGKLTWNINNPYTS
jgi:organic radical activating enzyme